MNEYYKDYQILESDKDVVDSKDLDNCICPKCGAEQLLGIDDTTCDAKECPSCKTKMVNSEVIGEGNNTVKDFNMDDSIENMVNESLSNKTNKNDVPSDWMECPDCHTVLTKAVCESEDGICPKCGEHFEPLYETAKLDTERRYNCPRCKSSYPYSRVTENECSVCNTLMVVYDLPEIKTSKTALPTE